MLCYVMWNLFTVGCLQFCNDRTIASLEANQNRPKFVELIGQSRLPDKDTEVKGKSKYVIIPARMID